MKIKKSTIHRLIADVHCGCRVEREYLDSQFKESEVDALYVPCAKHTLGEVAEVIEMMLREYLESEAEKLSLQPKPNPGLVHRGYDASVLSTVGAATNVIEGMDVTPVGFKKPTNVSRPRRDPTKVAVLKRNEASSMESSSSLDSQMRASVAPDAATDNLVADTLEIAFAAWDDQEGVV